MDCDFPPPQVQLAQNGWRVVIPGCETQNRSGAPRLPFRTVRVPLPGGCTVVGISARPTAGPISIEVRGGIERGAVPLPSNRRESVTAATTPASLVAEYPVQRAELVSVQRLAGRDAAVVRVFPARYLPAEESLEFCSAIEVRITVVEARPQNDLVAGAVFQPAGASNGPVSFDYLLVTKAFLLSAFQPLVDRKTFDGLAVKTEAIENILASQPGRDSAEKLRNYIRHACTNWGVRYVLLGGDIDTVPCRFAYAYTGLPEFDSYIPCDLYYSCLDGSWNSDNDSRWGEPTDGENGGDVDLLGEVYVGRAPVDTLAEAQTWVAKTVRYEIDGNENAGNALFLATYLGYYAPTNHAQGGDMLDPLLPSFSCYTVDWLDDRPFTTPQWGTASAIAALNRSPHVAIYNGHGDVDWIMQLFPGDLDSLTNRHPFLAYSVGCNAGEFDNDPFSPDCIGEQLLTRHSRGAFAAILNSRLGWFNPQDEEQFSGEFQTRFFERLLVAGQTNLGVAHQLSKHDMIGHIETSGIMTYRWCYYEINLLGDPHLALKPPYSGVTPQGTPHWWLAAHGWTNNFEAAALADADGDGAPAWREFVAGTRPTVTSSVLRVSLAKAPGEAPALTWPATAGRSYSVFRGTNIALSGWMVLTNGLSATGLTNTVTDQTAGAETGFYRVEVGLSP